MYGAASGMTLGHSLHIAIRFVCRHLVFEACGQKLARGSARLRFAHAVVYTAPFLGGPERRIHEKMNRTQSHAQHSSHPCHRISRKMNRTSRTGHRTSHRTNRKTCRTSRTVRRTNTKTCRTSRTYNLRKVWRLDPI